MASAVLPLVISGLSGIAGGLLNQNKKQTVSTRGNTAGDQSQYGSSTPSYDPLMEEMRNKLIYAYANNIDQDPNLAGYTAQGQSNINQVSQARDMALRNSLASRGLSYSPIAPLSQQTNDNARLAEHSQFLNSIPLLKEQLMQQKLAAAGGFFKGLPVGTTSTGSSTYHTGQEGFQEGNIPGSPLGGGLGSFATTLAGLYGKGAFGGPTKSGGNI